MASDRVVWFRGFTRLCANLPGDKQSRVPKHVFKNIKVMDKVQIHEIVSMGPGMFGHLFLCLLHFCLHIIVHIQTDIPCLPTFCQIIKFQLHQWCNRCGTNSLHSLDTYFLVAANSRDGERTGFIDTQSITYTCRPIWPLCWIPHHPRTSRRTVLCFSPLSIILPMLHVHSFIYHRYYAILGTDSILK